MGRHRTRRSIWGHSVCLEEFHRKKGGNVKITPEAPKSKVNSSITMIVESILSEDAVVGSPLAEEPYPPHTKRLLSEL